MYGIIVIDNKVKSLPLDLSLQNIRFPEQQYRYNAFGGSNYQTVKKGLSKAALAGLTVAGINTVGDLRGKTKADLAKLKGVGHQTAERLLKVGKLGDPNYRGKGFPWEMDITVKIPARLISAVQDTGKDLAQKALEHILEEEIEKSFATAVTSIQRQKLLVEKRRLEERLSKITAELV